MFADSFPRAKRRPSVLTALCAALLLSGVAAAAVTTTATTPVPATGEPATAESAPQMVAPPSTRTLTVPPMWIDKAHPTRLRSDQRHHQRHSQQPPALPSETPSLTPSVRPSASSRTTPRAVIKTSRFRISYPTEVMYTERFKIRVTFLHLHGLAPQRTYEWLDLMEVKKNGRWEMENTRASGSARTVSMNVSPTEGIEPRTFQFRFDRRNAPTLASPRFRVSTVFPTTPQGSPDDWTSLTALNPDGSTVRWNPCAPIRWALNTNGIEASYPQVLSDTTEAFARIAAHTGLTFTYAGDTTAVPWKDSDLPYDKADLFVAFASKAQVPLFTGSIVGLGGPLSYAPASDGTVWIDRAGVLIRSDVRLEEGFQDGGDITYGQILQHEILHSVGMGHARGDEEVMAEYASYLNHRFGAGDISGMEAHGASHGCAPPTASPVEPSAAVLALVR